MRERLTKLAETNQVLFHGSTLPDLEMLEPRQAFNQGSNDGLPAVFATDRPDIAIFMALLGNSQLGGWNRKKYGGEGFYTTAPAVAGLRHADERGYVYVLQKSLFQPDFEGSRQWRAHITVRPIGKLAVQVQDLPPEMTILPQLR